MSKLSLRCGNLQPGDILLKVADSAFSVGGMTSRAIRFGQSLVGSRNPGIVHAGLAFDSYYMIEAQSEGISAHDLRVQNKPYGYRIYRCRNQDMARGAGTCAKMMFDIHRRANSMRYDVFGAIGSLFGFGTGEPASRGDMDRLLDRILEGRNQGFFCSQFVVYVFQFVAEQCGKPATSVFGYSDAKATPSILATSLGKHALFDDLGFMHPNHR